LFSISASGSVGKALTYAVWRGVEYCRQWFTAHNPKDPLQVKVRGIFTMGVNAWHYTLSDANQIAWEDDDNRPQAMSGFNWHQGSYVESMWAGETPLVTPETF